MAKRRIRRSKLRRCYTLGWERATIVSGSSRGAKHCLREVIDYEAALLMSESLTPSIETEVQVMFFDTDCAGVVHNIAYLRFIEVARTLLAEQLGMRLVGMAERAVYPVVARTEIDYKRPARLGDKLVVQGRMDTFDRMRFWLSFNIVRPADGALIVQSRQMLCVIQMPKGRPIPLPTDWPERFAVHFRSRAE